MKVIYQASAEVRMPIFNSSLIIIASFMPLFFLSGMEGRLLIPLGIAFIIALIASTIVALTLTPVLCSYLLTDNQIENKTLSREPWLTRKLRKGYEHQLAGALKRPKAILWCSGALFAVAVVVFFTLGRSFLPPFNEGSFTVNISTFPGVSLQETDKIGRLAEDAILQIPEITTLSRKTGRAELSEHSFGSNVSELDVPYRLNGRTRAEVARDIRERLAVFPGVNVEVGQPISHRIDAMLSGTEAQIAIKVFGDDTQTLYSLGSQIKDKISGIDGVVDVNVEQLVERPEITITPRRRILAAYGITMPQFRQAVSTALAGEKVSQVFDKSWPYDIVLIGNEDTRGSIDALSQITVDSPVSGPVPLAEIAEIRSTTGPNGINRENVKRRIVVSANVDDRDLRSTVNEIQKTVESQIVLPENYYVNYGGQFESEAQASKTLALTSICAILVILMLLYAQFHNLTQSLIILTNIPLAMIGGVFILAITGSELNIPAIIGFISLAGISTRNGMLLISRYNALAQEGKSLEERIKIGSSDRLLPIIMTALTSALALIPLAIGHDKTGNEIQAPLALVILGGLITATALNIFVIPTAYKLIYAKK